MTAFRSSTRRLISVGSATAPGMGGDVLGTLLLVAVDAGREPPVDQVLSLDADQGDADAAGPEEFVAHHGQPDRLVPGDLGEALAQLDGVSHSASPGDPVATQAVLLALAAGRRSLGRRRTHPR